MAHTQGRGEGDERFHISSYYKKSADPKPWLFKTSDFTGQHLLDSIRERQEEEERQRRASVAEYTDLYGTSAPSGGYIAGQMADPTGVTRRPEEERQRRGCPRLAYQ